MKTYKEYLTEKYTKNLIVVDIQPMYENYFRNIIDMDGFIDLVNNSRKVLYFYNGINTVGEDDENELKFWLYDNGITEEKLEKIIFYDKGYGFFRSFMDDGIENKTIIKMIRILFDKKIHDSRDIELDEWEELLGNDFSEVEHLLKFDESFNIPDINIAQLKEFSNGYIVGGGKYECLKEVQLLMSAFNIKAKEISSFIY